MVSFNGRAVFIRRSIFLIPNHASLVDVKVPHASRVRGDGIRVDTERVERSSALATRCFVGKTIPVFSTDRERGVE